MFLILLLLLLLWSTKSSLKKKFFDAEINVLPLLHKHQKNNKTLKVLTWNIAFAYGKGSEGISYRQKDEFFFYRSLDKIIEKINQLDVDLLFLQEVDFESKRSCYIDQMTYISKNTKLRFSAKAPSWDINYLPFPYGKLNNHFGRTNSGGAILSKFPIRRNQIYLHDKPTSNNWIYNKYYLFRYSQFVEIDLFNKTYVIINNHLDAFDSKNRLQQCRDLINLINSKKNESSKKILLVSGDFNTVPYDAIKKSNFSYPYHNDQYEDDLSYSFLKNKFEKMNFHDSTFKQRLISNESLFTFPDEKPDRQLDYIFLNDLFKEKNIKVIDADGSSDHKAIFLEIEERFD